MTWNFRQDKNDNCSRRQSKMKPTLSLVFVAVMFVWPCIGQSISGEDKSQAHDSTILSHDSGDSHHSGDEIARTILNSCTVLAWIIGPIGSAMLFMGGAWRHSDPLKEMVKVSNLTIMVADSWLIARYFM
jgi:hypothetical protein